MVKYYLVKAESREMTTDGDDLSDVVYNVSIADTDGIDVDDFEFLTGQQFGSLGEAFEGALLAHLFESA